MTMPDTDHTPIATERRLQIVELLQRRRTVGTPELIRALGVSPATIRRDLSWLHEQGLIVRTRGGALWTDRAQQQSLRSASPSYERRRAELVLEKRAIGREAANLVQDGDTIILDAGSTTQAMVPFLARKRGITIITNSLPVANDALALADGAGELSVILVGGMLQMRSVSLVGMFAEHALGELYVDKTFLGVRGVSPEHGFTNPMLEEIPVKRLMIRAARQVVVLADHTKVGLTFTGFIAPVPAAHTIVTDARAPQEVADAIRSLGPVIVIAAP